MDQKEQDDFTQQFMEALSSAAKTHTKVVRRLNIYLLIAGLLIFGVGFLLGAIIF